MIGLSFGEIIVVAIVAILVIKPKDIPSIIKYLKELKLYFNNLLTDFKSIFSSLSSDIEFNSKEEIEEINRLLKAICDSGGKYEGEYDLVKIREAHSKILLSDHGKDSKNH